MALTSPADDRRQLGTWLVHRRGESAKASGFVNQPVSNFTPADKMLQQPPAQGLAVLALHAGWPGLQSIGRHQS
jgi:hypothetical protein